MCSSIHCLQSLLPLNPFCNRKDHIAHCSKSNQVNKMDHIEGVQPVQKEQSKQNTCKSHSCNVRNRSGNERTAATELNSGPERVQRPIGLIPVARGRGTAGVADKPHHQRGQGQQRRAGRSCAALVARRRSSVRFDRRSVERCWPAARCKRHLGAGGHHEPWPHR